MLLSIRNLGKIQSADIEINAITVIAGLNNSGKSTIGKTLFCVLNSFYNNSNLIETERLSIISRAIETYHNESTRALLTRTMFHSSRYNDLAKSIMADKDAYVNDGFSLQQKIRDFFLQDDPNIEKHIEKAKLDILAKYIIHILNISDKEILVLVLRKKMQAEFNMQINNLYNTEKVSEITLRIMDTEVKIRVKNNEDIEISDIIYPDKEVIYIDDPNALDYLHNIRISIPSISFHRRQLISCLANTKGTVSVEGAFGEIITSKKLDAVLEKLNSACSGKMERKTNGDLAYMENGSAGSALVDIVNVSTGLKTFVIIKKLLLNGSLVENGTLILDEPEIHLHPEWQLILAELIVLIQKEFNMHILINTHSPYFLDAIEVYSRKHDISNKCKYYLAESSDAMSVITDVSDNIELIYEKLARPLQDLENERYSDD